MRRRRSGLVLMLLFSLLLALLAPAAHAEDSEIQIFFDGEPVAFEVPPMIRGDRTYVPVRFVMERIQATVEWNGQTRQVTVKVGPKTVVLTIDSKTMLVNGKAVQTDVAPFIYEDRTMVPLRFLGETFGFVVGWDDVTRSVSLQSPSPLTAMLDVPGTGGQGTGNPAAPPPPTTAPAPATTPPPPAPVTTPPAQVPTGTGTGTGTGQSSTPVPPPTTAPCGTSSTPPATAPASGSASVVIQGPSHVRVGDCFTVTVSLQNVTGVKGADVTLRFNPTLAEGVRIISGNTVEGVSAGKRIDQVSGKVTYISAIPGAATASFTGSGTLCSVTFRAKAAGSISFTVEPVLKDSHLTAIPAAAPGTTVQID